MNFSLKHLLLFTTAVCAYIAIVNALPVALSLLLLAVGTALLPAVYLGGILYSRGRWRAFWYGAASCGTIPALIVTWWIVVVVLDDPEHTLVSLFTISDKYERAACYPFGLLHAFSLMAGMVVVWMRRIYKPSRELMPR